MTNPFEDKNLTREKLRRIVAAARQHVDAVSGTDLEFEDYNWHQPHHFNPENFKALDNLARKINQQFMKTFETLFQAALQSELTKVDQQYAFTLAEEAVTDRNAYYLPFNNHMDTNCGYLKCPVDTAIALVSQMLRDTNADIDSDRGLSELEESILLDVSGSIVDAFSLGFGLDDNFIKKEQQIIKGEWPVDISELHEMTCLDFLVSNELTEIKFTIVMISEMLDPFVGNESSRTTKPTPKQISDLIMKNVHKAPVKLVARVNAGSLRLEDIMNLKKGDLLMLHNHIDDPIDVLLNDRPCLKAYPAQCGGNYAIVMAEYEKE